MPPVQLEHVAKPFFLGEKEGGGSAVACSSSSSSCPCCFLRTALRANTTFKWYVSATLCSSCQSPCMRPITMPSRVKWYSPYKNTKPISAIESLSFSLPQEVKMSDQVILRCVELSQGWVINSQICFHQIWCEIIKGYQGGHLFVNTDSFPQNWDSIVMVIPFNWRTNLILDAQQGPTS